VARRRDILVLCYHAVSPTWPAALAISPTLLERQLSFLLRRGYRGATFSAAVSNARHERTLAVTFDDAYRSTLMLGKPVLDRLGLPGTVFVPTAFPGGGPMAWPGIDVWTGGPHEHELTPMSWDDLSALAAEGWEIGSHTISHRQLTTCTDDELRAELVGSRRACADALGIDCQSVAYPYGDVDARVVRAASDAGYRTGAALPARMHRPRPLEWPRLGVYRIDALPRFAAKAVPGLRRIAHTAQALRRKPS
jgi:peptidoglycan/xylan/chitin deacetylase (PgdA/CDA1 family)